MTQPCPRQTHEAVMEVQKRHVSHWEDDGTCSYCGSIKPEDFLKAVEDGLKITPTDKSYKAYIDFPPTGVERVMGSAWSKEQPYIGGWIEATPEVCAKFNYEPWGQDSKFHDGEKHWVTTGVDSVITKKFYFQHLSEDQRAEFVELYNAKKFNFAFPGHFYVMPFFCVPV